MPIALDAVGPPVAAHVATEVPVTLDAYAAIESQYVYRGVALRDDPTASFAVTTGSASGVFADAWASYADGEATNAYAGPHHHEWNLDLSAGYGASLDVSWRWALAIARVIDVGNGDSESRDYSEWRGNLFYREIARAQIAYASDYEQRGWSSWNAELAGTYPLTDALSGEWGIGHSHGAGHEDNDYDYGWLGVNGSWLHTQWDARWIDTGHGARYVVDSDRAGSRFVVSLSWSLRVLP